MIVILEVIEAL